MEIRFVVAGVVLAALSMSTTACTSGDVPSEDVASSEDALGAKCGAARCGAGKVCCNASCGICTEPDGVCTQEYCAPAPRGRACNQIGLCVQGYHWSETKCRCMKDSPSAGGGCTTDADCRAFSSYCDGCSCQALGASAPDPSCSGTIVQCFVDPCFDSTAVCVAGACTLTSSIQ